MLFRSAESAPQAMERSNGDPLHIALLDVDLQHDHNGWDLVRELRATRASLPIVMITARAGQLEHPLASQVSAIMEKPLDLSRLLSKIANLASSEKAGSRVGTGKSLQAPCRAGGEKLFSDRD